MMDNLGPEVQEFSDRLGYGPKAKFVLEGSGRVRWENLQDGHSLVWMWSHRDR